MFEPLQFRQARLGVDICFDLENIVIVLGDFIKDNPTAPKATLIAAARQVLRVSRQTSTLFYALVGGIRPEESRSAQIAEAHLYHKGMLEKDGGFDAFEQIANLLTDAKIPVPIYVKGAQEKMQALNLDIMLHSDPCPEPATGRETDRRTCIGPHGDYKESQKFGHWCSHYMKEWFLEWINLFEQTTPDRKLMGECLSLYAHIVKTQHQAGALVAGISTYWKWDNLNQFHKLLKACSLLTKSEGGEGTPAIYFALFLNWSDIEQAKHKSYRAGTKRLADSWMKNDSWVEWMLMFPNPLKFPSTNQ